MHEYFSKHALILVSMRAVNKNRTYLIGHMWTDARGLTISNNSRTSFSDSPRYLEARLDVATLKNVVPHSVATALASIVLPVPGGPIIATPCNTMFKIEWYVVLLPP